MRLYILILRIIFYVLKKYEKWNILIINDLSTLKLELIICFEIKIKSDA